MEQVTGELNLDTLLSKLREKKDVKRFKKLIERLYIFCIKLDVNQGNVNENKLEEHINALKYLERISIYLFSEYTNLLREYDEDLVNKAMQLCALVSEKIGDYLNHVNTIELNKLERKQIWKKQIKMYWKAAIAYTLGNNPPNSYVISKKFHNVLKQLIEADGLSRDEIDLYYFSYYILSRQFINNIDNYVKDLILVDAFNCLRKFINTGNEEFANTALDILEIKIQEMLDSYQTYYYWHLRHLKSTVYTIVKNSVWTNLSEIFSEEYILQLIKSKPSIVELWPNQLKVVNNPNGFLQNDSVKRTLINFPTSGGKSLLAEFAIIKELEKDNTKKCFYIVPTNALVYEVTKRLRERFRRLGYKVSSSVSGYEPELVYEDFFEENVIVTTPEKLDTIIRNNLSNDILSNTSLIIFDEFHKIQDKQRGWIIEGSIVFLINHINYKNIKLFFLSAIMDNGAVVLDWVNDEGIEPDYIPDLWKPTLRLKGIANIKYPRNGQRGWYPIPKDHGYYKEGFNNFFAEVNIEYLIEKEPYPMRLFLFPRYHYKNNNKLVKDKGINLELENLVMGVAQKLKNIGGCLIFFNSKEECENFVREYEPFFPENLELGQEIIHLINYIEKRLGKNHLLSIGLKKGIVYHHGSLPSDIREALEDYYSKGFIKIMVCTTTLVEGVNFPIHNFIYIGRKYPKQQNILDVSDFKNIVGRAGRAYQNTYGQIIYINFSNNLIEEHFNYENYQNEVTSSLLEDKEFLEALNEFEKLSEDEFKKFLVDISTKPFVKSLLVFYNTISNDIEDIDHLIEKTFFARKIEQGKLKNIKYFSQRVFSFFDEHSPNKLIKIQESGLSFKSFEIIKEISKSIADYFKQKGYIESIKEVITPEIYKKILDLPESKRFEVKKTPRSRKVLSIDDYNLFVDWLESDKTLHELSNIYLHKVDEQYRMSRMVEYVKDMFEFKLPWVIGTLSSMIIEEVGYVEYFAYLPLFIKYGVNNIVDVNLCKLGLNSRETVRDLSKFIQENTQYRTLDELRDYLKEADPLYFVDLDVGQQLTPFEVRKLVTLTNNYKQMTSLFEDNEFKVIELAGTKYHLCRIPERDKILNELKKGERLILRRERDNFYDEYAVEVYYRDYKIGYIPRAYNEEISYYLDLNSDYSLFIESINVIDINKFIEVKMQLSFTLK